MLVTNFMHNPETISAHMQNSHVVVEIGPIGHRITMIMTREEASGLASEIASLLSVVEEATGTQTYERVK